MVSYKELKSMVDSREAKMRSTRMGWIVTKCVSNAPGSPCVWSLDIDAVLHTVKLAIWQDPDGSVHLFSPRVLHQSIHMYFEDFLKPTTDECTLFILETGYEYPLEVLNEES